MSIDVQDFVKDCRSRGLTDRTAATYKSNITTFLNFVGNPLNVDTSILCKFLDYLKEMEYRVGKTTKKGVHPRTIKAYFSAISTYYDFLIFTKQINNNPIPPFTKRYLSRIKQQYNGENSRQLISLNQMKQLVNLDMPIQDKAILMILAKTGVRRGELIAMDIEDLNVQKKEIILKPKAKRTNRLVFFDDETAQVLRLFLEWRKIRANYNAFFISPWGFRINRDDINEIIAKHGEPLGLHDPAGNLNEKLTAHAFRHWHTTFLRRNGLPREFIQELRGDRRKDAIDIYDHIDLSELRNRYLECIPKLLETPLKLHASDLKPPNIGRPKTTGSRKAIVRHEYKNGTKAIFSLLKEHPEGLRIGQIATLFQEDGFDRFKTTIYRNLKNGNLKKDAFKRYSLTSQGFLTLERLTIGVSADQISGLIVNQGVTVSPSQGVTVSPSQGVKVSPSQGVKVSPSQGVKVSPSQGVKVSPKKITRPKGIIGGFTLTLYEYIQRHEGSSTKAISNFFLKKKDYVKQYLYNLKGYGLIINDGGNWYPTSKKTTAESHSKRVG